MPGPSLKTLVVIGTRPQFIKYAALAPALADAGLDPVVVDTGQHYDPDLAADFLDELSAPEPDHRLGVGGGSVMQQLSAMLAGLAQVTEARRPDLLVCLGDTNSTLAAALTGLKLDIPVAHIEAGERNLDANDRPIHPASMPEEANRVMTDAVSALLLCASRRAVRNLDDESVRGRVRFTGDLMLDVFLRQQGRILSAAPGVLRGLGLEPGGYYLATVHRAVNTDDAGRLAAILGALRSLDRPVVLPLHPRTRKMIDRFGLETGSGGDTRLRFVDPVPYRTSIGLIAHAKAVLTDSGGVTREAYWSGVPSVILDDTTAWIDIVHAGWSTLAGADPGRIREGACLAPPDERPDLFGDGRAAAAIAEALAGFRG